MFDFGSGSNQYVHYVDGRSYYISQKVKERVDSMSKEDIVNMIKSASSVDELFIGDNYNYMMCRYKELSGLGKGEEVCPD